MATAEKVGAPPAAKEAGKEKEKTQVGASADAPEDDKPMTFWEHLDELRGRVVKAMAALIIGCFVAWEVRDPVLKAITTPFVEAWKEQKIEGGAKLSFSAPGAGFSANIHLSILVGVGIASPIIFYQLWAFVAPGLYAREKKFVIPFVALSTLLFVGGSYFGYLAAFPIAFNYFLSFSGTVPGSDLTIVPTIMIDSYIDFVVQILLAFGIIFELPLLLLFLSIAGIVNYLTLLKFGRWFVLLAFIIAGILTPPDVTSQLIMGVPLIVLYFLSVGLAYIFGKKPTEEQKKAFWESRKKKKEQKASA